MRYLTETDVEIDDVALTLLLQAAGIENVSISVGTRRSDSNGKTFAILGKPMSFPRALIVNYYGDENTVVDIINQYLQDNG